jgi:UDP-N-acetylmuramyl tripeptide synthase
VAAGQPWRQDAAGCPACGAAIVFVDDSWACAQCDLRRPDPDLVIDGDELVGPFGRVVLTVALPGRANRANAAMAVAAAILAGVSAIDALQAISATTEVDGRYRRVAIAGAQARLLLAKNPAGWLEVLDMLSPAPTPVVVAVNARIADGRDPSWLWDVPFERLAGRPVAASGERSRDVAVRLRYAGVEHRRLDDPIAAVAALGPGSVDVAANYTALRDLDRRLRGETHG